MYPWRMLSNHDAYGDGFACGCGNSIYDSVSEFTGAVLLAEST